MAAEASPQSLSTSGNFRRRLGDRALRVIAALLPSWCWLLVMVLLVYEVVDLARPSMSEFGVGFLTGTEWNAVTDKFGALDLIWGTLATSLIALLIAVPIAIAIALVPDGACAGRAEDAGRHAGRAAGGDPERRARPLGDRGDGAVPATTTSSRG